MRAPLTSNRQEWASSFWRCRPWLFTVLGEIGAVERYQVAFHISDSADDSREFPNFIAIFVVVGHSRIEPQTVCFFYFINFEQQLAVLKYRRIGSVT